MNKKKVVIENTCYSLLLYFLYDKNWSKQDYFIYGNRVDPSYIRKLQKKVNKLEILASPDYSYKKNTLKFFTEKIKEYFKLKEYEDFYGNVKHIYLPFKNIRRFHVEDGLVTYTYLQNGHGIKKTVVEILNLQRGFFKNKVTKYLLTMSMVVPDKYLRDVIKIDIHEQWNCLNSYEKNEILDVFCIDIKYLNELITKKTLILTQCFSEDGLISEDEKIKIYKDIILKYDEDEILIKTHPREKTEYHKIFPNISIVSDPFPFELISLHGIRFEKIITLTSSSVFSFNYDLDIDYFGTESFPKLLKNTRLIKSQFKRRKL